MDSSERSIEIFAPFGEAFEITKKILFRPFDLAKWFVIGFAAWLATLFGGTGFNYRQGIGDKNNWNWQVGTQPSFSFEGAPPWVMPVVIGGALVIFALIVLFLWLNSRGRFMFTDCIVHNRGAIVAPWREYQREGNRYFVLQLAIAFCSMLIFGGFALLFFLNWHRKMVVLPVALLILFAVTFLLVALVISLIMKFVVPVMYRQRCTAGAAFAEVWQLIVTNPVQFLLFALFYVVLCLAAIMVGCVATCLTCCLAALPYIGTVILLPVVMLLFTYPLCFIRQFGDQFDVWAGINPLAPAAATGQLPPPVPPEAPPVQEPPSSTE